MQMPALEQDIPEEKKAWKISSITSQYCVVGVFKLTESKRKTYFPVLQRSPLDPAVKLTQPLRSRNRHFSSQRDRRDHYRFTLAAGSEQSLEFDEKQSATFDWLRGAHDSSRINPGYF
jgi:hypothetical protein